MWPEKVLLQFQLVPQTLPSENEFCGPYNKLLHHLFPSDTDFTVVPQYLRDSRGMADFILLYQIHLKNKPVFILELKPPHHLDLISKRQAADDQLRDRMGDLAASCHLPTLHAVSALGTRLSFYSLNVRESRLVIMPQAIPRDPTVVTDTAPADRWALDILQPDGEARFREVMQEIIDGCLALRNAP